MRANLGGLLILMMMGSFKAGVIVLLGQLANLYNFDLFPMIVAFCVLESGKFLLFRDSLLYGFSRFREVKERREEYASVMARGVKENRWPDDPFRWLSTAGLVLGNALFRGWIIVVLAFFIQRLFNAEPAGSHLVPWIILTTVEAIFITVRAVSRGTLATLGMSMEEMDRVHRSVIERHRSMR